MQVFLIRHPPPQIDAGVCYGRLDVDCADPEPYAAALRRHLPPGTVVNPLDSVTLSQALLFIDARDREQVARARKLIDERQGKVKVILTGGSYLDLMRRWQRPVFYDQQGNLTTKLGIRQVPALVTQDGRRLRIDELL